MLSAVNTYEGVKVSSISKRGIKSGSFTLKPGDILLMEDKPREEFETSHMAIKVGQLLTSHFKPSGSDMVHAILWAQANEGTVEPEIVEASGKGYVREGHLRIGTYHVWRCKSENWADWAAQIGMVWADGKSIPYGYSKSIKSITGKKGFGSKGRKRAKKFIEDAFNPSTTAFMDCGGAFCSQFVLSAYQAAAAQIILAKSEKGVTVDDVISRGFKQSILLRTDAYHCSVRVLHARLKEDKKWFKKLGTIKVKEAYKIEDQRVWRAELNLQKKRGVTIKESKIKGFVKPDHVSFDSPEWMQWVLEGTSEKVEK